MSQADPIANPDESALQPAYLGRVWAAGFTAALLLYAATVAPDLLMMDSGEYQWLTATWPHVDLPQGPENLVRIHVNYMLAAKLFGLLIPIGNWALRINLFSGLAGAIAVANACTLAHALTRMPLATALTWLTLGLGQTFWQYSVIAEVLTLLAATASAEILLVYHWAKTRNFGWLLALWAVNGFACGAHLQAGLAMPVYAALTLLAWRAGRIRPPHAAACLAVWLIGLSPYIAFCLQWLDAARQTGSALAAVTVGTYGQQMGRLAPHVWLWGLLWIALNYPTGLAVLYVPGVVRLLKGAEPAAFRRGWLGIIGINLLFVLSYDVPDQHSFLVPVFALAGPLIALGAAPLLRRPAPAVGLFALALLVVPVYVVLPTAARLVPLGVPRAEVPYRDPYTFYLRPWKTNWRGERRYVQEALGQLPSQAVFYGSPTIRTAMGYVQAVEHRRPDVAIDPPVAELAEAVRITDGGQALWRRPVFTWAPSGPGVPRVLTTHCRLQKQGILWQVLPPEDPAAFREAVLAEQPAARRRAQPLRPDARGQSSSAPVVGRLAKGAGRVDNTGNVWSDHNEQQMQGRSQWPISSRSRLSGPATGARTSSAISRPCPDPASSTSVI